MKVAILHLSDFHFTKTAHVQTEKIDKLVEALSISGGFDECLVIFSGDMTSRGDKSEFKPARFAMGRIINQIRDRFNTGFIPLFSVPGNHDMVSVKYTRTYPTLSSPPDNIERLHTVSASRGDCRDSIHTASASQRYCAESIH